jgi:hypothetical protein
MFISCFSSFEDPATNLKLFGNKDKIKGKHSAGNKIVASINHCLLVENTLPSVLQTAYT